jgi:hypothetical protein
VSLSPVCRLSFVGSEVSMTVGCSIAHPIQMHDGAVRILPTAADLSRQSVRNLQWTADLRGWCSVRVDNEVNQMICNQPMAASSEQQLFGRGLSLPDGDNGGTERRPRSPVILQ